MICKWDDFLLTTKSNLNWQGSTSESVKDRHTVIGKRKVFTTDQTHFFSPSPSASRITSRFSLIMDT